LTSLNLYGNENITDTGLSHVPNVNDQSTRQEIHLSYHSKWERDLRWPPQRIQEWD